MIKFISPSMKIGLRLLGVWPGVPYSTVYWLILMLNMLIIQYFQYLYVFSHFKMSELSNLVDSLSVTLDYTLTILKMIILWLRRRVLHQLLIAVDNDWRDCANVEQHLYVMNVKASISHLCYNVMLSFNTVAGVLYYVSDYVIHANSATDEYNETLRQLPVRMQLPSIFEQSPIFELISVIVFLHLLLNAYFFSVLNGLILALVFHVSGQIEIICQEFKNISQNISLYGSSSSILGMPICRHNKVILFAQNLEKLFCFIALMQVVWNVLVMCCLGFIIVINVNNGAGIMILIKIIFAYLAITIDPFITCFAGEYLSFKSISIADAAYEIMWYNMPPNHSKVIAFIIIRSHRRLAITAGKITDMSFETFSSIIKTSASYISVLQAIY